MAKLWRAAYLSSYADGLQLVNTFHGVTTEDTLSINGDGSAAQVRDAVHAALTTKYKAILPTDVTLNTLTVRQVLTPGSTDVPEEASQSIGLAGLVTFSGDRTPPALCLLVTLYSAAAIRSGHGRLFLPGSPAVSALDGAGHWQNAGTWYPTTVNAFLDELITTDSVDTGGGNSATWHPVIYSRTRHAGAASPYYFDISSYTKRTKAAWLRSRTTVP